MLFENFQLFGSICDYDVLLHQLPTWTGRASQLLGDLQIICGTDCPSVSVTEYLNHLHRVVMAVRHTATSKGRRLLYPGEFKGFEAAILRYSMLFVASFNPSRYSTSDLCFLGADRLTFFLGGGGGADWKINSISGTAF